MILENPKERCDFQKVEGRLGRPFLQGGAELVQLVVQQAHTQCTGVESSTDHFSLVVVEGFKFVNAQGRWDKWIGGEAEEPEKGQNTDADGVDDMNPDIGVQSIINMHIVWWWLPRPIRRKDPGVDNVGISRSESSYLIRCGFRGQVKRR